MMVLNVILNVFQLDGGTMVILAAIITIALVLTIVGPNLFAATAINSFAKDNEKKKTIKNERVND